MIISSNMHRENYLCVYLFYATNGIQVPLTSQPTTLQLLRSIIYPPVRATLREFQPTIEGRTKS